jgi:hypothetical protein
MAELKTKPTGQSVHDYIAAIPEEQRREDCATLLKIFKRVSGEKPYMWGPMVGFGSYHYKYASGHEGDCFRTGFAARKDAITLYITAGIEKHKGLLAKLGKHKTGKGCLYIKRLSDVDQSIVAELIKVGLEDLEKVRAAMAEANSKKGTASRRSPSSKAAGT